MRVLIALVQLQDYTLTDVAMNLVDWAAYFNKKNDIEVDIKRFSKYPFERNFNEICRYAIENNYDFLFQYDADMIAKPSILEKLIAHNKECVGALFFSRSKPHKPQLWDVQLGKDNEIDYFWQLNPIKLKRAIIAKELVKTDVRGGGFTLFKVSALKSLEYPYAQFKPSKNVPFMVNGIDVDITLKLGQKFGGVFTDCDTSHDVRHITFHQVSEHDYR